MAEPREALAGALSPSPRPAALLALWVLPSLVIAVLTALLGPPAASFVGRAPGPLETLEVLVRLTGQLYAELFLIAWFAAPTAALVAGRDARSAMAALARPGVLGVAAMTALLLTFALLLTMLPGLLALYVNPLMGLIFLTVGTIGGAAAAVGLFARWMFAPALAALQGLGATEALDASRAEARARRNFGFAAGLAVAFALVAGLAAAAGLAAGRAVEGSLLASAAASWVVLWPGLALIVGAVGKRHLQPAMQGGTQPGLALRSRPSRCPRCGALASAPVAGSGEVVCPGCGLRATLR